MVHPSCGDYSLKDTLSSPLYAIDPNRNLQSGIDVWVKKIIKYVLCILDARRHREGPLVLHFPKVHKQTSKKGLY